MEQGLAYDYCKSEDIYLYFILDFCLAEMRQVISHRDGC